MTTATAGRPGLGLARRLSGAVAGLVGAASAAGLTRRRLYRDPAAATAMFRAYDLVSLTAATPTLCAALVRARHGSPRAQLLWAAMLAYAFYTYAYYVFGAAPGPLFPVHVAVFVLAGTALVLLLRGMDVPRLAEQFGPRTPARSTAALLAFLATALGGMWTFFSLRSAVSGAPLPDTLLVQSVRMLRLGYVMDLTTLVPGYAAAAVLLWRQRPWGAVLATVLLVSSALLQLSYVLALLFQTAADVPGATAFDPQEPFIAAAIGAAAAALLANVRRPPTPEAVRR